MRYRTRELEKLENELIGKIKEIPPIVRMIYADGHEERTSDTLTAKQKQVAGALLCYQHFNGWHDEPLPPDTVVGVIYEDGTHEDYIEWAQQPPMTAEEAKRLLDEIANNC